MIDRKISSTLIGVSGEYFVAAELSRRGYVASITLRNIKGIDIVVSNDEGSILGRFAQTDGRRRRYYRIHIGAT